MNISCAPQGIVAFKHPKQGIGDIAGAGFERMMLNLAAPCLPEELEHIYRSDQKAVKNSIAGQLCERPENMAEYMGPILDQCMVRRLRCSVAQAPYLKNNTKRDDLNNLLGELAMACIRVCNRAKCGYLIVQPLFAGIEDRNLWECNRKYYLGLADCAKQEGVQILLENQCKNYNGHLVRGICSDAGQVVAWIDALNDAAGEERFGFCLDVGACNLCGQNMHDFMIPLGNRIKAVILRDGDGHSENSLLMFTGVNRGEPQTDWMNLIRGLREVRFDGELIMDLQDTASAFSPILRPRLLMFAKSVVSYFKWQIEIEGLLQKYSSRVLFGAGNMCRNYMKCYGEEYPPLFAVDNNSNIWGTNFCGLSVKSPEMLKDLPQDCAVFICNIYYREIEAQLRGMELQNPIEYFSDEYMPMFEPDRLKGKER